jgi:hypothetical protein
VVDAGAFDGDAVMGAGLRLGKNGPTSGEELPDMGHPVKTSVIIPALNEAESIGFVREGARG